MLFAIISGHANSVSFFRSDGLYVAFEWRKQVYYCSGKFLGILALMQIIGRFY